MPCRAAILCLPWPHRFASLLSSPLFFAQVHLNVLNALAFTPASAAPLGLSVQPAPSTLDDPALEELSAALAASGADLPAFRLTAAVLLEDAALGAADSVLALDVGGGGAQLRVHQSAHMNLLTVTIAADPSR